MSRLLLVALALAGAGSSAAAQGALSTQGLGFPPGQISTRAEGSGGSTADFDALSPINPAAIAAVGNASLFLQYSPEFRRVTAGSSSATTTTARFPIFGAVIPVGTSWTAGIGASTFLDRSFETRSERRDVVGDILDTVDVTERFRVLGAINDVRLGLAWANGPKFRIGGGAHLFTGRNRVTLEEIYTDSLRFLGNSQESVVAFTGFGGSLGFSYHPSRIIGFAVSARKGGKLRAAAGDTALGDANIPDRVSAGVTYDGITGATLSARVSYDTWSALSGLSSSTEALDGWDASLGAEASGPRVMQRIVTVRAGGRYRTLPFGFNGEKVRETAFMAGFGVPLTRNRASFDFAVQRAMRSTSGSVKERGLILSFGLRVSP
jgi:hypothetical protein